MFYCPRFTPALGLMALICQFTCTKKLEYQKLAQRELMSQQLTFIKNHNVCDIDTHYISGSVPTLNVSITQL